MKNLLKKKSVLHVSKLSLRSAEFSFQAIKVFMTLSAVVVLESAFANSQDSSGTVSASSVATSTAPTAAASAVPMASSQTASAVPAVAVTSAIKFMPEKVTFPADYKSKMVSYTAIDRYDTKVVRRMYATAQTLELKEFGQLPYGTQLVMVDEKAKLDEKGDFVRDQNDRFVSTGEITRISVMEKGKGWGAQYPDYLRNGEWEMAVYDVKGKPMTSVKLEACFQCHSSREETDYNYSFYEWKNYQTQNAKK